MQMSESLHKERSFLVSRWLEEDDGHEKMRILVQIMDIDEKLEANGEKPGDNNRPRRPKKNRAQLLNSI